MSNITKEKSGKYRVLIRKKEHKTVSRTFSKKKDATAWRYRIKGYRELLIAEGSSVQ